MTKNRTGTLLAPVMGALAVATALLALVDPSVALCCLPLLVFAWALYRGRTWGAFGLLGISAVVLLFSGVASPRQELLAACLGLTGGLGLACFGLVAPVLWRHDALATSVTAASVLGLCLGGTVWVCMPPDAYPLPLDNFCSGGEGTCVADDEDLPYGQRVSSSLLSMEARPDRDRRLRVMITNNSLHELLFVHPLPDSSRVLGLPVYGVTALDAQGRLLEMLPPEPSAAAAASARSPLRDTTLVQPGETFSVAVSLPRFNGTPASIQVTYDFEPGPQSDEPTWLDSSIRRRLLAAVLVGQVSSPWVKLPLPKLKSCF